MPRPETEPTPVPSGGGEGSETVKETLESIIIAFILAFVFRAYVVEAFVIPTGSMAPTLLGHHLRIECSQCGYHFESDSGDDASGKSRLSSSEEAFCPMCYYGNELTRGERVRAGDRILVHKYIYSLTDPKRWDVVVFKNPQLPTQNFIKRLVGLPDESICIIEGNVYSKPREEDVAAWKIARKSDYLKVQHAVWQPIYHSQYVPLDQGQGPQRSVLWHVPWSAAVGADHWQIEGRRTYEHHSSEKGSIEFNFKSTARGDNLGGFSHAQWYSYNQLKPLNLFKPEPIEDIRLAVGFQPTGAGLGVELQTTARVTRRDGKAKRTVILSGIEPDGTVYLLLRDPKTGEEDRLAVTASMAPFAVGRTREIELWHVDQEISLWVDGDRVLVHQYEVDYNELRARDPLHGSHFPELAITVYGSPVKLHRVEVGRDLYYSSRRRTNAPRGTVTKSQSGEHAGGQIDLKANQFYCLGDNSPMSQDSRYWASPTNWIKLRMFDPEETAKGIVPRTLMMGKAFFVYFPAALAWNESGTPFVPNFAGMRFIY